MKKMKSLRRLVGDSIRPRMKTNGKKTSAKARIQTLHREPNQNGWRKSSQQRQTKDVSALRVHNLAREQAIQRYTELYDFAPTGYVSFNRSGRIAEINLAAA